MSVERFAQDLRCAARNMRRYPEPRTTRITRMGRAGPGFTWPC